MLVWPEGYSRPMQAKVDVYTMCLILLCPTVLQTINKSYRP